MEPGYEVVNTTRAKEAVSPWLNHPRKTIIKVEGLVIAAAALLLLQLILGCCKRRWHKSFLKYGLQVCNGVMFPLIVYTLGTMQSSPIKNSSYPVWAGFLIMASAGTTAVHQYDLYDSFYKRCLQVSGELFRDLFYVMMFVLLMDPNTYNWKTAWELMWHGGKNSRASSHCVFALVIVVLWTKIFESISLLYLGYKRKWSPLVANMKSCRTQAAESTEETTPNDDASVSNPQSMEGYKYEVSYRLCGGGHVVTIDEICHCCHNAADANALEELCLSCALFSRLVEQCYFGTLHPETRLKAHNFVFEHLLPTEWDFKRAFRIIEVELGFCYDFFFTKYNHTFVWMNFLPVPFIQSLIRLKNILILIAGVLAIKKSVVLETPDPIIEVHISEADYIITILVLGIAFVVELAQAAFYLASNWAQVSLACMHVKKHWYEPNAFIFGEVIGFLRRVMICGQLRNKINQHSAIFQRKQPDPVEVSDAMKRAIARSLRSTYANNLTADEERSLRRRNQMSGKYSWALNDFSQLEVMLIWHIATEAISDDPSNGNGTTPSSIHRGAQLFGHVLQLLRRDPRRNKTAREGDRGVAVHLSRYCAYLIGSVAELLPYHEADIAELSQELMEEYKELFQSCDGLPEIYSKIKMTLGRCSNKA